MVKLYSNDCPRCKVLKQKMDDKGIEYSLESAIDTMISLGIKEVPILDVDGTLLDFVRANDWINGRD